MNRDTHHCRRTLVTTLPILLAPLVLLFAASASAQPPKSIEVRVDVGTKDGQRRFIPDSLRFERGKYYKLLIHNPSPEPHYFTSDGFATHVFSRKVEVMSETGETIIEVHGDIRDIELLPGSTAAWFFYPMTRGKNLRLYCHKDGHGEAGMVGTIEIYGPPPFTGQ